MFRKNELVIYNRHISRIKEVYPDDKIYLIKMIDFNIGNIGPVFNTASYFVSENEIKAYKPTSHDSARYAQKYYDEYKKLKNKNVSLYKAYKRPGPVKQKIWNNLVAEFGEDLTVVSKSLDAFVCATCKDAEIYDAFNLEFIPKKVFILITKTGIYRYIVQCDKIICRI